MKTKIFTSTGTGQELPKLWSRFFKRCPYNIACIISMTHMARLMQDDLLHDSEDGGKMRVAPGTVQKMHSPVGEISNTSAYSTESYQSSSSRERVRSYDGQNPQDQERFSWFVLLLTTISAIGGFLFGYDTGVVSGAMLLIKKDFGLSDSEEEVVVSITIASAVVAAVAGGPGMERFGRKPSILLAAVIFTVGAVLLAAARSYVELVFGRLVIGFGIGLASLTTPVYIAEAAPSNVRGTLVTLNTLFITVGQVVAGVVDGLFANVDGGWRWMLGLSGIPSLLMTVGFL